jgi:hypothetical protein
MGKVVPEFTIGYDYVWKGIFSKFDFCKRAR